MKTKDPIEVMEGASEYGSRIRKKAVMMVEHFIEHGGEMFLYDDDLVNRVAEYCDCDVQLANKVITHLASDQVDPVIHVTYGEERYIGVADFYDGDWWYGFTEYDDFRGEGTKIICRQCISEGRDIDKVGQVFDADLNESIRNEFNGHEDIVEWMYKKHFKTNHPEVDPSYVDDIIGASLATNTTINSNTAWHDGNVTASGAASIGATNVDVSGIGTSDLGFDPATPATEIYVLDDSNNKIRIYDISADSWSESSVSPEALNSSNCDMVGGGDGNLYIIDFKDNEIHKYDISADSWDNSLTGMGSIGSGLKGVATNEF